MAQHPSSPELLVPLEGAIDPDLIELPRPPRAPRLVSIALMIATAVVAAVMAAALVGDVRYALAGSDPSDVGDLARWAPDRAMENQFVRASGRLGSAGAIRYERPLERDSFRLAPVAGNEKVWVEMRVPEGVSDPSPVGAPTGALHKSAPPTTFVGRLVPLGAAALRYRGLRRSVEDVTGTVIPADAWVLVDGATPAASRWTVALAALFLVFAGYNLVTIARMVRPVRA